MCIRDRLTAGSLVRVQLGEPLKPLKTLRFQGLLFRKIRHTYFRKSMSKNYFRCHLAFCVGITGSLIFKFVDENAGLRAVEKTRLTYILTCITAVSYTHLVRAGFARGAGHQGGHAPARHLGLPDDGERFRRVRAVFGQGGCPPLRRRAAGGRRQRPRVPAL